MNWIEWLKEYKLSIFLGAGAGGIVNCFLCLFWFFGGLVLGIFLKALLVMAIGNGLLGIILLCLYKAQSNANVTGSEK